MKTNTYIDYVTRMINAMPYGIPIRTAGLVDDFVNAFQLDADKARQILNVYLGRLVDRGVIVRLAQGVYGKAKATVFGVTVPEKEKMITDTYLFDGEGEAIGYETGAALFNRLGLCTLIPRERQIATNRYRAVPPSGIGLALRKPLTHVTTENAPYLQIVEVLKDLQNYPIDAENPDELIRAAVEKHKLDDVQLIRYMNTYLKPAELQKAIGIVFGRLDENAAA